MTGNTRIDGRKRTKYSSYDCASKRNKKSCSSRSIRKDQLDAFVLAELYDKVLSEVSIQDISARMSTYSQKISEHGRGELDAAQKELAATVQNVDRLIKLVMDTGVSVDTVADQLKRLEASKTYLERRIDELKVSNTAISFTDEVTVELLHRSREIVKTRNLVECRNLMYAFVDSVVVYSGKVDVKFKVNVPDAAGHSLVPLQVEHSKEGILESFKKAV